MSGWFAILTLQSDVSVPDVEPHGRALGIDLGLLSFLATSEGETVKRPNQEIADTRKDFHFKTVHHLCNGAGMLFTEDLNFKAMSRGMLCKHTLDAGFGQFLNILNWVSFKRGVFFAKVDANYTSQLCPECGVNTGKKELSERVHHCPECGYTADRDVAAAQVIKMRGLIAAGGHSVKKSAEGTPCEAETL